MTLSKLSRRDFLKGAGATGMVGALALGGAGVAFAEEGATSGEAAAAANPYRKVVHPREAEPPCHPDQARQAEGSTEEEAIR